MSGAAAVMAAEPTPGPQGLPVGTAVVFVSDEHVDAQRVRRGSQFRAHLRSDLMLGSELLAPAGAPVRLVVDRKPGVQPPELALEIERFHIVGGALPVAPRPAVVHAVEVGQEIPAVTQAIVERIGDRTQIRIPLPVSLGTDVPAAGFTPLAAQTPRNPAVAGQARGDGRRGTRRASPTPTATLTALASPTPAAATPSPSP